MLAAGRRSSTDHGFAVHLGRVARQGALAPSSEETGHHRGSLAPNVSVDRLLARLCESFDEARAVSATSRQPLSMVRACPRFVISIKSGRLSNKYLGVTKTGWPLHGWALRFGDRTAPQSLPT
jgi:hypothetical protein